MQTPAPRAHATVDPSNLSPAGLAAARVALVLGAVAAAALAAWVLQPFGSAGLASLRHFVSGLAPAELWNPSLLVR